MRSPKAKMVMNTDRQYAAGPEAGTRCRSWSAGMSQLGERKEVLGKYRGREWSVLRPLEGGGGWAGARAHLGEEAMAIGWSAPASEVARLRTETV